VGKNTGQGSVAAVARDDTGLYLGASVVVFPGKTEAKTLESLACREAVSLPKDINARKVRVASDCKNVVVNLEKDTIGVYTYIVWEIQDSAEEFEDFASVQERRISNKEAHCLARSVLFENGRHVWLMAPPEGIGFRVSVLRLMLINKAGSNPQINLGEPGPPAGYPYDIVVARMETTNVARALYSIAFE
jgi:ribonuclease HI